LNLYGYTIILIHKGSIMSKPFKHILIYSIQQKARHVILDMIVWLETSGYQVSIEANTNALLELAMPDRIVKDVKKIDLIMVVGGDGSILSASQKAIELGVPIMGINTGKLGFLADHDPTDYNEIAATLTGQYDLEPRSMLNINIGNDAYSALNEVMVSRQEAGRIISLKLFINDRYICGYSCDGLMIVTPTGSTAHALSAGGPIMHPDSSSLLVVPVCPHKLNSRPIVIPNHQQIKITIDFKEKITPIVSMDGFNQLHIPQDENVLVNHHPKTLHLVRSKRYHFYETLKRKLHWEEDWSA
jgi:NAD+ kinase